MSVICHPILDLSVSRQTVLQKRNQNVMTDFFFGHC